MEITQQNLDHIEIENRRLNTRLTNLEQRIRVLDTDIHTTLFDIREAQLKLQHDVAAITQVVEGK